jgi:hypothetical protein
MIAYEGVYKRRDGGYSHDIVLLLLSPPAGEGCDDGDSLGQD